MTHSCEESLFADACPRCYDLRRKTEGEERHSVTEKEMRKRREIKWEQKIQEIEEKEAEKKRKEKQKNNIRREKNGK